MYIHYVQPTTMTQTFTTYYEEFHRFYVQDTDKGIQMR